MRDEDHNKKAEKGTQEIEIIQGAKKKFFLTSKIITIKETNRITSIT